VRNDAVPATAAPVVTATPSEAVTLPRPTPESSSELGAGPPSAR
jgi:hypothetical protein